MAGRRSARGGVLVVGGGFAGGYVARLRGRRGATLVSDDNFMLYTPILPEAASGTLEPRHVTVPLRLMCPHAELILGRATSVDEQARTVTVETEAGTWRSSTRSSSSRWARSRGCFRSPASPSTRCSSRTSATRSVSATTSSTSSRARRRRPIRRSRRGT